MSNMSWLASEGKQIFQLFQGAFYIFVTVLLSVGVLTEYFKMPLGNLPNFPQLLGRALVAALLLHSYPTITNMVADVADSLSAQLGGFHQFQRVLDRMGEKIGELSWSWVSFKDTVMLIISFLTFFLLYFSIHIAQAFYLYTWTLLYVFSPILIALFVLPATASATKALFRSLIEVACWKIVWAVIATLLWSSALGDLNKPGFQVSFLAAISFNIILAGSLLLTPFVVHALAGSGLGTMTRNIGAIAIGALSFSPGGIARGVKRASPQAVNAARWMKAKMDERKQYRPMRRPLSKTVRKKIEARKPNQMEFNI